MSRVVTLTDVTYAYSAIPAVEEVSLTIEKGEFCGLVGPNGSGKSTVLKLMLGLVEPDQGSATLFGDPAASFSAGERVGYVAQNPTTATGIPITVREVVRMGRYPHVGFGRLDATDERAVDRALDTAGIADLADRRVGRLSGGQRQRVFIARALAGDAAFLALDEPAVGVDADSRDRFYRLLCELNGEGLTIVLIEHDVGLVADCADHLVCLNRRVFYDGPSREFLRTDAFAEAYGANRRLRRGDGA